jgi:hypothetical protein
MAAKVFCDNLQNSPNKKICGRPIFIMKLILQLPVQLGFNSATV